MNESIEPDEEDKGKIDESNTLEPVETVMTTFTVKEIPKEYVRRTSIEDDYDTTNIMQSNIGLSIPTKHVRIDNEEA